MKNLIHENLMSLLFLFCFFWRGEGLGVWILRGTWSSSKEEIVTHRCFLWIVLFWNTNYSLIKPSNIIMMNWGFQIKSWIFWNDTPRFLGGSREAILIRQATLKWKLMNNQKAKFKYVFLNFSSYLLTEANG